MDAEPPPQGPAHLSEPWLQWVYRGDHPRLLLHAKEKDPQSGAKFLKTKRVLQLQIGAISSSEKFCRRSCKPPRSCRRSVLNPQGWLKSPGSLPPHCAVITAVLSGHPFLGHSMGNALFPTPMVGCNSPLWEVLA